MMRQRLGCKVRSDLTVEKDESGVERRVSLGGGGFESVRVVRLSRGEVRCLSDVARKHASARLQFAGGGLDLITSPFNRVDLLSDEGKREWHPGEERETVARPFALWHELLSETEVAGFGVDDARCGQRLTIVTGVMWEIFASFASSLCFLFELLVA